jgi:hypothetical protein
MHIFLVMTLSFRVAQRHLSWSVPLRVNSSPYRWMPLDVSNETRTHFAHRIDLLDATGEIQEHLAGVEDSYWPRRYGARQSHDGPMRPSSYAKAPSRS